MLVGHNSGRHSSPTHREVAVVQGNEAPPSNQVSINKASMQNIDGVLFRFLAVFFFHFWETMVQKPKTQKQEKEEMVQTEAKKMNEKMLQISKKTQKSKHFKPSITAATTRHCRRFFKSGQPGPTGPKPQGSGRLPLVADSFDGKLLVLPRVQRGPAASWLQRLAECRHESAARPEPGPCRGPLALAGPRWSTGRSLTARKETLKGTV